MSEELKESMRMMSHQIENIKKEIKIIKKEQNKNRIVGKYNNLNEKKKSLEGLHSRFELAKRKNQKLYNRTIAIIQFEEQKV